MALVYLIGNQTRISKKIMEGLNIDPSTAIYLPDYQPKEGDLPVLISSDGTNHGDTLTLSDKLRANGVGVEVKVIFDRHSDQASKEAPAFCSHASKVYDAKFLEALYLLGIKGSYSSGNDAGNPTNLRCSRRIKLANRINGKRVHSSVDIDVIRNLTCVGMWSDKTGPTLEELTETLGNLIQRNQLVGFDMAAFIGDYKKQPNPQAIEEGLRVYNILLTQIP